MPIPMVAASDIGFVLRTLFAAAIVLGGLGEHVHDAKTTRNADPCPFEQVWYAGDQHELERLIFRPDGSGDWLEDVPYEDGSQQSFQWSRDHWTLSVHYSDVHRTVGYVIERSESHCYLTFDDHPILLEPLRGYTHFRDYAW